VRIGVDLDDVIAVCAVPYLRAFAERFGVDLPDEREIGWHLLERMDEKVSPEQRERFRVDLYDGRFFGELEVYEDAPATLERIVAAGHEVYFITARAERRRVITETWLRDKGLMEHAKAVHLRPQGDFAPTVRGRYDASGSARYKVGLARELELDRFCEDDVVVSRSLAEAGVHVWLFDQAWNRELEHPLVERVSGWSDVAATLGLT
jgi:uncharacterized HAD superfamily protein